MKWQAMKSAVVVALDAAINDYIENNGDNEDTLAQARAYLELLRALDNEVEGRDLEMALQKVYATNMEETACIQKAVEKLLLYYEKGITLFHSSRIQTFTELSARVHSSIHPFG